MFYTAASCTYTRACRQCTGRKSWQCPCGPCMSSAFALADLLACEIKEPALLSVIIALLHKAAH
jgi:hypothetical protein